MSNSNNSNKKKDDKDKSELPKMIPVVFNEDDAFEEFEMDTWKVDSNAQNKDADLWTDDWGDKDVDEAFEIQLRNEIQSNKK